MPTIEEVDTKVANLKESVNALLVSVDSLRMFRMFLVGAGVMLAVMFGGVGFWLIDTLSESNRTLDDATERVESLDQDIDRLRGELAKLDTTLSRRFQQVEQSVVDITSQPLAPPPGKDETLGEISTPELGSTVGSEFQARGTVRLGPNQVAWLAVRIGRLYWPKEPPIEASGPWNRRVYEGGVPGRKWLALLVMKRDVSAEIEQWFETARQTGSYPGMRLDRRAIAVAEVEFTLR